MFSQINNEKGGSFAIAILLLFITTSCITFYYFSYESQIKTFNSLEFANVRATINLLEEIGKK